MAEKKEKFTSLLWRLSWTTALTFAVLWGYKTIALNMALFNPVSKIVGEYSIDDFFYERLAEISEPDTSFVVSIVDITDVYSRRDLAELLTQIEEQGPKVIGIDCVFEGLKEDKVGDSMIAAVGTGYDNLVFAYKLISDSWDGEQWCITQNSFFADSRKQTAEEIAVRCNQIVSDGGTIIDVGAYSTRPGAAEVSEAEEMERLRFGLDIVRRELPYSVISVDTFRPDVARMAVEEFGADIINDVSEGSFEMYKMVARLRVPYILMSVQPDIRQMLLSFAEEVQQLRDLGVKDIILDPGFGFGKTLEQNYEVMSRLEDLLVMGLPLLVGVSRKSMIYKLFGFTANDSLNGTTVLNTISLMKGASILRVHDVREAVECCKIIKQCSSSLV